MKCPVIAHILWLTANCMHVLALSFHMKPLHANPDTNGTEESVHISEVSLFQGLNFMHGAWDFRFSLASEKKLTSNSVVT